MLQQYCEKIESFGNFCNEPVDDAFILETNTGSTFITRFEDLAQLATIPSDGEVAWYRYRLHAQRYSDNDELIDYVHEFALSLSVREQAEEPVVHLFSFKENRWQVAEQFELKIDMGNKLKVQFRPNFDEQDDNLRSINWSQREARRRPGR